VTTLENNASFANQKHYSLFPFGDTSPLTTTTGIAFPHDGIADMRLVLCGSPTILFLSLVELTTNTLIFRFKNRAETVRLSATVLLNAATNELTPVYQENGTIAGYFVPDVGVLRSWALTNAPANRFVFANDANCLVPDCLHFHPYAGVQFKMPDGSIVSGPVVFVGESGVILRYGFVLDPALTASRSADNREVLRVDFVGDPLPENPACDRVDEQNPKVFLEDFGGASRDSFGNIQIATQRFAGGTALKIDTDPLNKTIRLSLAGARA
jgi:hypothetical protein